ncbi:MAG: VWA domain-containing protein [Ilumatobacteraceae bacterium]
MTLLHPSYLWLLAGVLALVALYVVLQRRRRHYAVRFTNLDLLESVAPKRPGWRRHVPAAIVGVAMVAGVIGLARPAHDVSVPKEQAIVMLVMDTSLSMAATDVSPTRLQASITAAQDFVDSLPSTFSVGLVSFSGTATVAAAPTTDHKAVKAAIGELELGRGTAAGDAINAAVAAIKTAEATIDDNLANRAPAVDDDTPVSSTIVLLSDGGTTVGADPFDAAQAAGAANIPVSTITYGTERGVVTIEGETVAVPPDAASMQQIAELSGGKAFDATNMSELSSVYRSISAQVGHATEQRELVVWFLAIALILMTIACIGALYWSGRML